MTRRDERGGDRLRALTVLVCNNVKDDGGADHRCQLLLPSTFLSFVFIIIIIIFGSASVLVLFLSLYSDKGVNKRRHVVGGFRWSVFREDGGRGWL